MYTQNVWKLISRSWEKDGLLDMKGTYKADDVMLASAENVSENFRKKNITICFTSALHSKQRIWFISVKLHSRYFFLLTVADWWLMLVC